MQPRRPDSHTAAQRAERHAAIRLMVKAMNSGAIGSTRQDIASVYAEEVRRGSRRRVLT